jgi:hypothetical protein
VVEKADLETATVAVASEEVKEDVQTEPPGDSEAVKALPDQDML